MLPGFNHNVKYKDRVYHVQTEDSGVENPHIITHLFFGGNIIYSQKTSYADIVASGNLSDLLVDLMQGQHKTILRDLIRGRFDKDIEARSANAATLNGPAPLNVDAGAQHRVSLLSPGAGSHSAKPAKAPAASAPGSAPVPPAAAAPPVSRGAPPPAAPVAATASKEGATPGKVIEAATLEAAFESKDDKAVDSIFGNLISEKSLDEVILSYLADDNKRS